MAHGAAGLFRGPGPCGQPKNGPGKKVYAQDNLLRKNEAHRAGLRVNFKHLTERDFRRLSTFITRECGIKMPDSKKTMVEARLRKRLRALDIGSFKTYCEYLFSDEGMKGEVFHMLDMVTTNKTDFFREPVHYEYLTGSVMPGLIERQGTVREFKIWSAGCSTGEEPYTLAMVLNEFKNKRRKEVDGFRFNILATDISIRALKAASMAVYREEKIEPVPVEMRKRYLLRSRDRERKMVKIVPELRAYVKFRRLNFMEDDFKGIPKKLDVIFFRNVLIYFKRETQEAILKRFTRHLRTGGVLFVGHSETLTGLNIPSLQQERPTVYRKT